MQAQQKPLSLEWTRHLPENERQAFAEYVKSCRPVLSRLYDLISEKHNSLEKRTSTLESYTSPSWAYQQAHFNGMDEFARRVLELLEFAHKTP